MLSAVIGGCRETGVELLGKVAGGTGSAGKGLRGESAARNFRGGPSEFFCKTFQPSSGIA